MRFIHIILALTVVMVWGFTGVVIQVGLEDISPVLLCFSRLFLTSIPAVFFIKRPATSFSMILWYGLVMFALQFVLLFAGMSAGVTPGLAALLQQIQVFFTAILAASFFGEKLHRWQIVGSLVTLLGIGLVGMNLGDSITLTGFLLVIGSAASWGAGNVISKKIGQVNMISLVVWGSLVAWPPLLALSCMTEGVGSILYTFQHLTWLSGGAVLFITGLSTLFAFAVWSWLLHHYPLGTIAPFALLVPVFGIISSVLFLSEPLQGWKILALLLVVLGLCITLLGPRLFAKLKPVDSKPE